MTKFILILIWLPFVILGFNYIDWRITRFGGKPNYLLYFIWRGGAAILHGILCLIFLEDKYVDYGTLSWWRLLFVWAPYVIFQVNSFWIVYELVRNIWTKAPYLLYYDTVEKDSGVVDRFFAWTGPTVHAYCKLLSLILVIISIIVIWTRH